MAHIVFQISTNGDLVAIGQISCSVSSEPYEDNVLGNGFIGITILEVFIRNVHDRMIH